MHPATRVQMDYDNQAASDEAMTDFDGQNAVSVTRQELGAETDINNILSKFGIEAFANRQPIFTNTDYDTTLQDALTTVTQAREIWQALPEELKRDYPTWQELLVAVERNEIILKDGERQTPTPTPTPTPPTPPLTP